MSEIETLLLETTGFKPKPKHEKDRQLYLNALAVACDKLPDDDYETLPDEATDWINAAIEAIQNDDEIPELSALEDTESDDEDDADDVDEDDDDEDVEETDDDEDDDETENDEDADDEDEDEATDTDDESEDDEDDDDDDSDEDEDDDDEDEEPEEKPRRKVEKVTVKEDKTKGHKKVPMKGKASQKKAGPHQYKHAERDRYGLVVGTKVSQAVALFEKGAPMKLIKEKLGGPQNNVLDKLRKQGHLVEKFDGVIKVTHKDDIETSKKKSK